MLDYIKARNELVKMKTGVTLVPDEQLVEFSNAQKELLIDSWLYISSNNNQIDESDIDPYCVVFHSFIKGCRNCPMALHDNKCTKNDLATTYGEMISKIPTHITMLEYMPELIKLYDDWINELIEQL